MHDPVRQAVRAEYARGRGEAPPPLCGADLFFGLRLPVCETRRQLYASQYRGIWTFKRSARDLDEAFRKAYAGDAEGGGWTMKSDERSLYTGKLVLAKGDAQLKVAIDEYPEAQMSALKVYTIPADPLEFHYR